MDNQSPCRRNLDRHCGVWKQKYASTAFTELPRHKCWVDSREGNEVHQFWRSQAGRWESSRDWYWHTLKWRDPSPDTTKLSVVKQQHRNVKAFDLNTGLHGILQIHAWKLHRMYINSEYQSHND